MSYQRENAVSYWRRIKWLMRKEQMSFKEAIRYYCNYDWPQVCKDYSEVPKMKGYHIEVREVPATRKGRK